MLDEIIEGLHFIRKMEVQAEYSKQCNKGVRPAKYAIANNLNKSVRAKAINYKLIRGCIQRNK